MDSFLRDQRVQLQLGKDVGLNDMLGGATLSLDKWLRRVYRRKRFAPTYWPVEEGELVEMIVYKSWLPQLVYKEDFSVENGGEGVGAKAETLLEKDALLAGPPDPDLEAAKLSPRCATRTASAAACCSRWSSCPPSSSRRAPPATAALSPTPTRFAEADGRTALAQPVPHVLPAARPEAAQADGRDVLPRAVHRLHRPLRLLRVARDRRHVDRQPVHWVRSGGATQGAAYSCS